jgi:hypothetical protein
MENEGRQGEILVFFLFFRAFGDVLNDVRELALEIGAELLQGLPRYMLVLKKATFM